MAEETQASPQEAPPAPEAIEEASAAPGSVIPDQVKADRPVENLSAEMNRKFAKLQQQQEQLLAYLAQQSQPRQAAQPPKGEVTDEDLWSLAQQGDRNAFDEYMDRKAQCRVTQALGTNARVQQTQNQIAALMQKYPMLQDPTHALTQTANQALALMARSGENTQDAAVVLRAMFTAIAERPDLVSEHYSQTSRASEQGRRSAGQVAQSGQTTVSHRAAPAPKSTKPSPEVIAQAKRMGNKDPEGVMKRFYERQAEGKSSVSPMLKAVLESEEGA